MRGSQQGQAHLAAVGVSAEYERDGLAAGMFQEGIDEVGRVAHEEDGLGGLVADGDGHGEVGIGAAEHGVVNAGEPDAAALTLNGEEAVAQNRYSIGCDGLSDLVCAGEDVVIAEDGELLRAGNAFEQLGALPRGARGHLF